jgi:hypothetical protein
MQKLQYTIVINAPAQKVYETMLGLHERRTYENWASTFNPTSTYEGAWDKGSKILFVGTDENGKKGGMVSKVVEHRPAEFVSICHYGFLQDGVEVTTGEMVEKWAGGHENYTFEETDGATTLTVEMDVVEEYLDYFNDKYPAALRKLKAICK